MDRRDIHVAVVVSYAKSSAAGLVQYIDYKCRITEGVHVLLAARANDADTATSDVLEAGVKAAELGTDVEEHAMPLLWVLDLR